MAFILLLIIMNKTKLLTNMRLGSRIINIATFAEGFISLLAGKGPVE
jgi:hypothetical protein